MNQPTHPYHIAIDIGGTTTRLALFPTLTSPSFTLITTFPTHQDYTTQQQSITHALTPFISPNLSTIGVSIGGRLAPDGRSVLVAPNLLSYVQKTFASDLESTFSCPVYLAHDTICGLLAEKRFGTLSSTSRCAYLTLSTGTGAAVHLSQGSHFFLLSIEIGHQIFPNNPLHCLCGQTGCLETLTGGRQLELRLNQPLSTISDPTFWDTFSSNLALGLINLAQLTRVTAIAVSGSIALYNPFILSQTQSYINTHLTGATLTLHPAHLQENAPLIGAALLSTIPSTSLLH